MKTFDDRLLSFNNSKWKSSSSKSSWPHPQSFVSNPKLLAEAGFFFKPSKDNPDNVQCFICKKELDGWEEEDNPFELHVNKCPKCPWAIARCSLEFDVDSDGNFSLKDSARLPSNKVLEKARLDTFGGKQKWWPHDSVRNHGANSKKMAKAGFVYTPQTPDDDTATCFYCDLSLSGWDAEDDPIEEHRKREARSGNACPFFQADAHTSSQGSQKTAKTTSRKSRATKQAAPSIDDESEAEPAPPAASGFKKTRQKQTASSVTNTSRKKSVKAPPAQIEVDESEDLEEEDDPSLKVKPAPRKPTKKVPAAKAKPAPARKGKRRIAALSEEDKEDEEEVIAVEESAPLPSKPDKKGKEKEEEKEKEKPPSSVDGKVALPAKGAKAPKARSKSKPKFANESLDVDMATDDSSRSQIPAPVSSHADADTEGKASSAKMQKPPSSNAKPTAPKHVEEDGSRARDDDALQSAHDMDVDEDEEDSRQESAKEELAPARPATPPSKSLQPAAETTGDALTQSPQPASVPPRPTTPENQIHAPARPASPPAPPISNSNTSSNANAHADVDMDADADTVAFQASVLADAPDESPLALFLPPLAAAPLEHAARLTDAERAMTVEQWIRHEMARQHLQLRADGERRIEMFKARAAEVRARIEAL